MKKSESLIIKEFGLRSCAILSFTGQQYLKIKSVTFLIDGQDERFWFSFAVGSCGGLLFSIIALIFVLPVFVGMGMVNDER